MNSCRLTTILPFMLVVAFGLAAAGDAVAADSPDYAARIRELAATGSNDPQAWFQLAQEARGASELAIARQALAKAADLGLGSVRVSLETARIYVAGNDPKGATAELRGVLDSGFTAVSALTGDPVINSLAGNAGYDALIEEMSVLAYPCAHQAHFQDFDFWIGEWDVHLANGTPAGSNVIRSIERGCALSEHWVNVTGGTGMSINYFDEATDEWVQIWNAEGGSQIIIRGGLTPEGMAMKGYINYVGTDTTAPFRALWTPLADGRVRQYFELSNDDGVTWNPWFEGFYTRRKQ